MAEQIYPLTFEGRESNPRMLGGSGVLNTPLKKIYQLEFNVLVEFMFLCYYYMKINIIYNLMYSRHMIGQEETYTVVVGCFLRWNVHFVQPLQPFSIPLIVPALYRAFRVSRSWLE